MSPFNISSAIKAAIYPSIYRILRCQGPSFAREKPEVSSGNFNLRRPHMNCPGCVPESKSILLENEHCFFSTKDQDVLEGSGVIMPKKHRATVFELTAEEWNATQELLVQAKDWLDTQYKPDGYNLGWNCGDAGGQHLGHAHLHVIPRFEDEPLAGRGIRWWFKQRSNRRRTTAGSPGWLGAPTEPCVS